jgi:spermidine/putrescine transport system permease protein
MNKKLLSSPYIIWILIFTILPLALVIYYGFTAQTPDGIVFTFDNIKKISDPLYWKAFLLSARLSLLCTVICLILAYPLALILAKSGNGKKTLLVFFMILPMWMNFLLRTYAWLNLLEGNGVINTILQFFGMPKQQLVNTPFAVVLGMVYNFLPFMVLPIYNVLIKIDDSLIQASSDLGANKFVTFRKIIFPLSLPGVISGITMVFVPAITTFVISDILGGGKIQLIGNIIEQEFTFASNWHTGSGLSLVLMVIILFSMAIISKFDKDGEGAGLW